MKKTWFSLIIATALLLCMAVAVYASERVTEPAQNEGDVPVYVSSDLNMSVIDQDGVYIQEVTGEEFRYLLPADAMCITVKIGRNPLEKYPPKVLKILKEDDPVEVEPELENEDTYSFNIGVVSELDCVRISQPKPKDVHFIGYHAGITCLDNSDLTPSTDFHFTVREGDTVHFDASSDDGYMIESVRADGGYEVKDSSTSTYEIEEVTEDLTVVVTAVPEDRILDFDMQISGASYEVEEETELTFRDPEKENRYHLTYKADGIRFLVHAPDEAVPVVYYVGHDSGVRLAESEGRTEDGAYGYTILWKDLPLLSSVIIQEQNTPRQLNFKISYPVGKTDPKEYLDSIFLRENDTEKEPVDVSDQEGSEGEPTIRTLTYHVDFGQTVTFGGTAAQYQSIAFCTVKSKTTNRYNYVRLSNNTVFSRTIPVIGNTEVMIETVERYRFIIKRTDNSVVSPVLDKGTSIDYCLECEDYTGELYKGKTRVSFEDVLSPSYYQDVPLSDDKMTLLLDESDLRWGLRRTYEFQIQYPEYPETVGRGRGRRVRVGIESVPKLKSISTITSLPKEDATGIYEICTDSRAAITVRTDRILRDDVDISGYPVLQNLAYRITYGEPGVTGETLVADSDYAKFDLQMTGRARSARLNIQTKIKETDETKFLYVHLYNTRNPETDLALIPLRVVKDPKIKEQTPAASVCKRTDVAFTLEFPVISIAKPYQGKTYYKVSVTPKEKEGTETPSDLLSPKTYYVERTYPVLQEYPDEATDAQIAKIDQINDKITRDFRQYATFPVNSKMSGEGVAWDFDVCISCVDTLPGQTLSYETEDGESVGEKIHVQTGEGREQKLTVSTPDPVFATQVKLNNKQTSFYAGEQNVLAAILSYSKGASCMSVTAEDITDCTDTQKLQVRIEETNDFLLLSSDGNTMPGKHTIQITPYGAAQKIYQAPVTLQVTVYKAIDEITVEPGAKEYLKQKNKALTIPIKATYNKTSGIKPQTAKASFYIVDEKGQSLDTDSSLYDRIKITNGKVVVDASYEIPEEEGDSISFCVKAVAEDFGENMTYSISDPILIKNAPLVIGELVLLSYDEETHKYNRTGTDGDVLTTEEADGAIVAPFMEGAPVKEDYYRYELSEYTIDQEKLKFTTSNKTAMPLTADPSYMHVQAEKTAKNVALGVTTTDGGNNKAQIKISIVYAEPAEMCLAVNGNDPDVREISFFGNQNTVLPLSVMKKDQGGTEWETLDALTNYKLTVKGGTILQQDYRTGTFLFSVGKDKATLSLQDVYNKKTVNYTVTNTAYAGYKDYSLTAKAQNDIISGMPDEQKLTLTVSVRNYDPAGKCLLVTCDNVDAQKAPQFYANLRSACPECDGNAPVAVSEINGKYGVELTVSGYVPARSYKLSVVAGRVEDGKFIPETVPAAVTVKSIRPRVVKGSFRPTTSFRISKKNPAPVTLSVNGREVRELSYTEIYNCNVGGHSNHFTDYFVFTETTAGQPATIGLKDDLSEEELSYIQSAKGSSDRTCFVKYTVAHGNDGYGNPLVQTTAVVKITISFIP
ncbi:MAG: hypothetical protein J5518_09515 [Lachnospiraceae bacterium]|nr:hypothetical protein [Lachnospiraceae bacterium]